MLQLAVIIELIAVGPGDAALESWGTCALRVIDRRAGTDQVLGAGPPLKYVEAIGAWSQADRTVTRRVLAVPEDAAIVLAKRASAYARGGAEVRPERGLATAEIAEELDLALRGALEDKDRSSWRRNLLRPMILEPTRRSVWLYVGLDLLLLPSIDAPKEPLIYDMTPPWERPFLCSELARLVDATKVVSEERDAWVSSRIDPRAQWSWPWIAIYALFTGPLFVFALVWSVFASRSRPPWPRVIYGAIAGAVGMVMIAVPISIALGLGPAFGLGSAALAREMGPYPWVTNFIGLGFGALVFPATHVLLLWPRFPWARRYLFAHAAILVALLFLPAARSVAPAIGAVLPIALVLAWRERPRLG